MLAAVILLAVGVSLALLDSPPSATSSQSLAPTSYPHGQATGNALVVYDPGSTATVKDVASRIASNLQAKGYSVCLAGIESEAAANPYTYQVVVVGGPLDDGNASSLVQSYLANLNQGDATDIGIFGVGNSKTSTDQIAPLPINSVLIIKQPLEINPTQNISAQCAEFVTQLLS